MSGLKPHACPECAKAFGSEIGLIDHRRDVHGITGPSKAVVTVQDPACMECGKVAVLVTGERIYPHRPDLYRKRFWRCECGAYCGCHGVTTRPLGFPCGPETRRARLAAHDAFDPIWRGRDLDRRGAYTWLAREMQISPEDCHIGMMTAAQAWNVVRLCRERRSRAA